MRINKVIDLLEQDQPVYYVQTDEFTYENGEKMAKTWADYIRLNLEHGPYDISGVHDFMKGLVAGGPVKSGHRTPAIIAELPFDGTNEHVVHANAWMVKQLLATGIHGFLFCHVEDSGAAVAFVESMRYSFQSLGVGEILGQGRRGHGGQKSAASIWGISEDEYLDKADLWPLNGQGELLFGVKIENTRALKNTELTLSVPGLSFAEWGPGDMGMALGYKDQHNPPYPDEMKKIRQRVLEGCRSNDVYFLNAAYNQEEMTSCIDEGVMFMRIGDDDVEGKLADFGRKYTNRKMPW